MEIDVKMDDFVCEIHGFRPEKSDSAMYEELRSLLYQYKVLVFRGLNLDIPSYKHMVMSFGSPLRHVLQNYACEGHPEIIKVTNLISKSGEPQGILDGGAYWHSDMSYRRELGVATAMYATSVSKTGGETHFLDLVDGLKEIKKDKKILDMIEAACGCTISEIKILHKFGNRRTLCTPNAAYQPLTIGQNSSLQEVQHNLIEKHPKTKLDSLFAIAGTANKIIGLEEQKSLKLLNAIEDFVTEAALYYQHKYRVGDVVIWDNMTILHKGYGIQPTRNENDFRMLLRSNVKYN